jgi:hypothetical protein
VNDDVGSPAVIPAEEVLDNAAIVDLLLQFMVILGPQLCYCLRGYYYYYYYYSVPHFDFFLASGASEEEKEERRSMGDPLKSRYL